MDETFKIYIHHLKEGHQEKIDEMLSPDFLGIHETALAFHHPVRIHGIADATDQTLVLRLTVDTQATMPCAICNEEVQVKISIPDFYHTQSFSEIKGGVFDYKDVLREAILIELPYIAECCDGDCPERVNLAKYLARNKGD